MFVTKALSNSMTPKQFSAAWEKIDKTLSGCAVQIGEGLWQSDCSVKLADHQKVRIDVGLCESLDHIFVPKKILNRGKQPNLIWLFLMEDKVATEMLSIRLNTLRQYLKFAPEYVYTPQDKTPLAVQDAHLGAIATDKFNLLRINLNELSESDSLWLQVHCAVSC